MTSELISSEPNSITDLAITLNMLSEHPLSQVWRGEGVLYGRRRARAELWQFGRPGVRVGMMPCTPHKATLQTLPVPDGWVTFGGWARPMRGLELGHWLLSSRARRRATSEISCLMHDHVIIGASGRCWLPGRSRTGSLGHGPSPLVEDADQPRMHVV